MQLQSEALLAFSAHQCVSMRLPVGIYTGRVVPIDAQTTALWNNGMARRFEFVTIEDGPDDASGYAGKRVWVWLDD